MSVPVAVVLYTVVLFSEWLGASHRRLSVSVALPVPLDLAFSSIRLTFFASSQNLADAVALHAKKNTI